MTKTILYGLLSTFLLLLAAAPTRGADAPPRPNIVVILVDDMY